MNLFRRLGAALPGAKDQGATEAEDDPGGFGPPGGVLWTTPVDVLSDRPKAQPSLTEASPAEEAGFGKGDDEETGAYSYGARGSRLRVRGPQPSAADDHPAPAAPAMPAPSVPAAPMPDPVAAPASPSRPADPFTDISATADIAGFVSACLVDSDSGLLLAAEGGERLDLEAAAALNTQVVRAEHAVIQALGLDDHVEDILVTMRRQLHFLRPLEASPAVFLYVCLDKKAANLGMARMQVNKIESGLKL